MDIDQLLAKHPAPWVNGIFVVTDDRGATVRNLYKDEKSRVELVVSIINACAALKAENAKYRAAIGHADWMLECEIDGPDFDEARANYDAARKELP